MRYLSFRRLRARMLRLKQETAQHRERARIARDMYDDVGAKLTRLSLLSEMVDDQVDLTPAAKADVREISDTARETILAFDEIVWASNPRNDTLGDLTHYLCRYAEDFFEGTPTECVFDLPQVIPPLMLVTEVRHQVFLAAKEALNNIMKHAHAGQVRISLILHSATFEFVIKDDGRGFDSNTPDPRAGGGNGLRNLRERMQGMVRSLEGRSHPEGGPASPSMCPSVPAPPDFRNPIPSQIASLVLSLHPTVRTPQSCETGVVAMLRLPNNESPNCPLPLRVYAC